MNQNQCVCTNKCKCTFTLIDVAYKYWMNKPFSYKDKYQNCRFSSYYGWSMEGFL